MTNTSNLNNVECFIALEYTNEPKTENRVYEAIISFICSILAFLDRPAVKFARFIMTFSFVLVSTFLLICAFATETVSLPLGILIAFGITFFGVIGFRAYN